MKDTISVTDICGWRPCVRYQVRRNMPLSLDTRPDAAYIRKCLGDRDSIVVDEVLGLRIPFQDRIWLLTRPRVLPANTLLLGAWMMISDRASGEQSNSDSLIDAWLGMSFGEACDVSRMEHLDDLYAMAPGSRLLSDRLIGLLWPHAIRRIGRLTEADIPPGSLILYSMMYDCSTFQPEERMIHFLRLSMKGGFDGNTRWSDVADQCR